MSVPCLCRWLSCNQNWTRVSEAKSTCPIKAIVPRDRTGAARRGWFNKHTSRAELVEMIDGLRDRLRDFESTSTSPRAMFSGHKEKTTRNYLMRWLVSGVKRDSTISLRNGVANTGRDVCILLAHCQQDYYFSHPCLLDSVDSSVMYCNRWWCRCRMSTTYFKAVFPVWFPLKSQYWWSQSCSF